MERKYGFTLKGAIWWEKTSHQPFDLSHVVFIRREIDADDAKEAIKAAEKIIKDLREKNPSKNHKDYGVKAELFLGQPGEPLWTYNFSKGKMKKAYWDKLAAKEPKKSLFFEAASRIFTIPPDPPQPMFKKGGVVRLPGFSQRRIGAPS